MSQKNDWKNDDTFLAKWLDGSLSEEERRSFESSDDGKRFDELMKAASILKSPEYDVEAELAKIKPTSGRERSETSKVIWMQPSFRLAVAASLAILVVFFLVFKNGPKIIETGISEQELVLLPDGSEVRMNVVSKLSYDEESWKSNRTLDLDGEAFFKVKEGSDFIVNTPNGSVKVVGTSFNVKNRSNRLAVVCHTGEVMVRFGETQQQLLPNMELKIIAGQLHELNEVTTDTEPSWTNGVTQLENVTFEEVMAELSLVFGITVEEKVTLDQLSYTGAFPNQNAEAAIKLVLDPLNIAYEYDVNSKRLIILGMNQ